MCFQKDDIIIRDDATYPEGALIVDGFDDQNQLLAYPLGGGLQFIIPVADFTRFHVATEVERAPVFRRGRFSIEGIEATFSGWTDGHHWNGWARPAFEFAEAEKVVVAICPHRHRYDSESDRFVKVAADGEEESWPAKFIKLPNGNTMKIYAIGAGAWTWDEDEAGGAPWV